MATPPSQHAMSRTPHFQELRIASGSDNLERCFHLLFTQQHGEIDGLINVLCEKRDGLLKKIERMKKLIQEGEGFCVFHDSGNAGLECMKETLKTYKKVLAGLTGLLDVACEGRRESRRHVSRFE
ncbi:hypothetical protein CTI12_AA236670 [Artemisia annua]|uniref:ALIX V-shaped domain-containing protein n=1 Tax=Artemisia annua TaxID=35608 RepID=A0A2U1NRX4_ARTAN|nr:hypothetical protein CTI12_AA531510 [Artemisia annua]PWA76221.1 hypothetical protein CTI12_AA236670 [Artemisia annua]